MREVTRLLNDAGVGRYDVGGRFGEPVPNVEGAVGRAGLALREAVWARLREFTQLTWTLWFESLALFLCGSSASSSVSKL